MHNREQYAKKPQAFPLENTHAKGGFCTLKTTVAVFNTTYEEQPLENYIKNLRDTTPVLPRALDLYKNKPQHPNSRHLNWKVPHAPYLVLISRVISLVMLS